MVVLFSTDMYPAATSLGVLCFAVFGYFILHLLGVDESFALPYTVVGAVGVAMASIHFIQIGSSFMNKPKSAIAALCVGIGVILVSFVGDSILGQYRTSISADLLTNAQNAGVAFAITVMLAWLWAGTCIVGLVRSIVLQILSRRNTS